MLKIYSKKAMSEILSILIVMAIIGGLALSISHKSNTAYRSSSESINSRLSSQMTKYTK